MSLNLEWAPIKEAKCQRKRPAGRSGHTVTAMGPNVYMFGGLLEGASPAGPTDELWLLTMSSTDAEWHVCEKKVSKNTWQYISYICCLKCKNRLLFIINKNSNHISVLCGISYCSIGGVQWGISGQHT